MMNPIKHLRWNFLPKQLMAFRINTPEKQNKFFILVSFQLTFTFSNSIIKTLEKGVKYVQSSRHMLLILNIFHTFF